MVVVLVVARASLRAVCSTRRPFDDHRIAFFGRRSRARRLHAVRGPIRRPLDCRVGCRAWAQLVR